MLSKTILPTDAAPLLPHQPPVRMVTRLLACGNGSAKAEARVELDHPLVDSSGKLERAALIEMMAQTYAAMKSYEDDTPAGDTSRGYLVGLKKISIFGAARAGQSLSVAVETEIALDNFCIVHAAVTNGAEVIADGCLKLWLQSDA